MNKKFKFIAAFSLSAYFDAFVCNACIFCLWFILGCYLYIAFCFHGVSLD